VILLAVDPGLNGCGAALLHGDELAMAAYTKSTASKTDDLGARVQRMAASVHLSVLRHRYGGEISTVLVEWPRFYPGKHVSGHALLSLAGVAGAIFGTFLGVERRTVEPPEWKGNLEPEAMIARIRGRLTPEERGVVVLPAGSCAVCSRPEPPFVDCEKPSCLAHNVFDAVGIGLWAVGRLQARKAVAR